VWGKLLAIVTVFTGVLVFEQVFSMFFYHLVPNAKADEIRGPFSLAAYVVPALAFGLPIILFTALTSFAVGLRRRKPILVFVLPVAMLLVTGFFLWDWSPTWLDPRWNKLLMALDPAGFRWLNETHLKLDRGVDFYNKASIPFDAVFWINRLGLLGLGVLSVLLAERHFVRTLRGQQPAVAKRRLLAAVAAGAGVVTAPVEAAVRSLRELRMTSRGVSFWRGTGETLRVELRELRSSPGLYLFVPLILIQTIGGNAAALGPFGTFVLATPGGIAVRMMNTLSLLVCLLLLFYTVESHQREKNTGFAAIADATPVGTAAMFLGKSLANAVVGITVLVACFLGAAAVILYEGQIPVRLWPFLLVWGLIQVPTFLVWTCFVTAVVAVTRNRYATYAVGLVVLIASGYFQFRDKMNWVFNWNLWNAVRWSDLGTFQLDRMALVLNRLLVLSLAAFFVVVAVRFHRRRDTDAVRLLHRLRPRALVRTGLALLPFAAAPLALGTTLGLLVHRGAQSEVAKKKAHDYWKQNLATWKDAPQPEIVDLDLDLELEPERSHFASKGRLTLSNHHDTPLRAFALTGGRHWAKPEWTLNGKPYTPEDRTSLFVFTPERPLAPGETAVVSFRFQGDFPKGISRNGGGAGEFILPSGVVLTAFGPSFLPVVGYDESIGVEEEKNQYEPRVYADDFYVGRTEAAFGSGSAFTARVAVSGPAAYRYNSVGVRESDVVKGDRRTTVWRTDRKVRLLNVVAGKWKEARGEGTAIYYHPAHETNIPELLAGLNGARKYYSLWFREFPWKELKLSEFPGLATYAQGFPTNITFSEAIGFLTQQEKTGNAPFTIAAHEAAHQWWGNMVLPGKGPGGNLISEGMSHFSTILLIDQVKGASARIEFCKRIEENYGDSRQVDSERPMVKIDGSRPGDNTVTYDKMGWVMWMLLQQMGRDNLLRGLHDFQETYAENPDHPVLQDLTGFLRPYAPDPAAYDAFVRQWFHEVVVPEYVVTDAKRATVGGGWDVTAKVTNRGSATMPVQVAAVTGDRFDEKGVAKPGYREARGSVMLGKGESKEVRIRCPFRPERVVVDPDVQVLQLRRNTAVAKLDG